MAINAHYPLILASGSATRRAMLERVGLEFSIHAPNVDEEKLRQENQLLPIAEQAIMLAKAKAEVVSHQYPNAVVIGADQICALGDQIFCKPLTHEHAIKQLQEMRGKTHHQYSGAAVFRDGQMVWHGVQLAELTMRSLTDNEIEAYLQLDMPYHACGSYHYEAHGKHLFQRVQGSDDCIFGLILQPMLTFFYESGVLTLR